MTNQEITILTSVKTILEYLDSKYGFKLNSVRFHKLIKSQGFPVTKIGIKYAARTDFIDKWIDDLFNNKIIENIRNRYDLVRKPERKGPSKFIDKVKYRYPKKRGRKKTWKEEIDTKSWEFFLKKIDLVLPWHDNKNRNMIYSSAKKLILNKCSVTLIVNVIEQCMWASYREAIHAYQKEGTPFLNFRERKKFGSWKEKVRGKLTIGDNASINKEDKPIKE